MRVSEHYKLGRFQSDLDFVDVDVDGDVALFVDPRALRTLDSPWGERCRNLVQDFFGTVLACIHNGDDSRARQLLGVLNEPNETRLGLSRGHPRGRGIGRRQARTVWESLSQSEAVHTGLVEDLEDTILMVEGLGFDKVSDITTNIIREPLIEYTQDACKRLDIPLLNDVVPGPVWNPDRATWESRQFALPASAAGPLIFVPKIIVRKTMDYDQGEYYRHFILEHLEQVELDATSELVYLIKSGRNKGQARVRKKDLRAKYGEGKKAIVRLSREYPEVLQAYKRFKAIKTSPPLNHVAFAEATGSPLPAWDSLACRSHVSTIGQR